MDKEGWSQALFDTWIEFFERHGVFFSSPLDLDMLMLEAFPEAYMALPTGAKGPQNAADTARQTEAAARVLGADGFGPIVYEGTPRMALFPWYAYLFLGTRGKPAVHLTALATLDDATLKDKCPSALKRLITRIEACWKDRMHERDSPDQPG